MKIGVTGVIPLGTTGESPTIDEEETERIVERTVAVVAGRVPIVVGVSGNDTRKAVKAVKRLQRHPIQGVLDCLWRQGLIGSPECRLPLPRVSEALAAELERALAR